MLLDARSLADRSTIETDVCVVGAGPAGITIARELAGSGVRVCLVESGGVRHERDVQELSRLAPCDGEIEPPPQNRRRQFGGNANLWRAGHRPWRSLVRYLPLDEIDFAPRPWVPHGGWPFARSALDPYYARAHRMAGVGEYCYDARVVSDGSAAPLPLDPGEIRTSVEWFGTSRPFLDEARVALERSANVTVLCHATVVGLEAHAAGARVERVRLADGDGRALSVAASMFVLAAGGIENARLLLDSGERRPAAIGNERGLLGRYFMDHLHLRGVLVPSDPRLFETAGLYDVRADASGRIAGCKLNLTDAVMENDRLLNGALKIDANIASQTRVAAAGTYARLALRHRQLRPSYFGWSTLPRNASRFRDFSVHLQVELAPDPENRVTLADERDALGRRRARVSWRWDDLSRSSAVRARRRFADAFARAGVGTLRFPDDDPPRAPHREGVNHHIGTTRMHDDPRQGVVDANCRVHETENLFVAGSSVFPTGGYANPTLTILALSIRLADHLRGILGAAGGD